MKNVYPERDDSKFSCNVGKFVPGYTAPQATKMYSSQSLLSSPQ